MSSGTNPFDALKEVERRFRKIKSVSISNEGISRNGWRVPAVRSELKAGFSFSSEPLATQLDVWDYIWKHSSCYEAMSCSLYFYQNRDLNKNEFSKLASWVNRVFCWEHSDDLS